MILEIRNFTGRAFFYGIIFLCPFLCSTVIADGQIAGGLTESTNTRLGGNNYIVGMVFWPTGEPLNTRINIRLSSPTWGEILATTDDRGKFVFSGVGAGVYTLVIDGEKDFAPVRQEVDITRPRNAVPETYTLTIRLENARNFKTKAEKPSVISAANADVPKQALEFYQKASTLAAAKDYKGAIEQLKLAVVEYPAFLNALNAIGVLYIRLNQLDKADEALQAALKIKPDAYEPLINRGILLFRLARLKETEPILRAALGVKAESTAAYYYLGRTLYKLGRNDEAESAFLACIKIRPGEFKEAHRLLAAIYLGQGSHQRVVEELETYLLLVPNASDAENLRSVIEQNKQSLNLPQTNHKPTSQFIRFVDGSASLTAFTYCLA
ncbi:MAG: tetratricopeptide repeat protein [Pyrinomonadaceae bacterium]